MRDRSYCRHMGDKAALPGLGFSSKVRYMLQCKRKMKSWEVQSLRLPYISTDGSETSGSTMRKPLKVKRRIHQAQCN